MAKVLTSGDHVSWRSHGATAVGRVVRKLTSRQRIAGRTVAATPDDPQFLVKSDKSGGTAVHKPDALTKRR